MQTTRAASVSRGRLWTGRVISGFVVVFMIGVSAFPKLIGHESAAASWERFGYDGGIGLWIGILEAAVAVLYAIPRTAVLGAIVLVGYLGGATATHVRIGDPWFLFPIAIGILAWIGLFLREDRLRALVPLRSEQRD